MMSSQDGFSIVRKMLDEQSRLWVVFVERDRGESFDSKVLKLTDNGELLLSKYEVAAFRINLESAEFRYADPREAADPAKAGESFDFCLALSWPNGARCRLFVVRDEPAIKD
jgi:hypothetical protein